MWTWHQPIRFEFPAAFVRDVLWPYLEIMRPVLVLNPHVQVYLSRRVLLPTSSNPANPPFAIPFRSPSL